MRTQPFSVRITPELREWIDQLATASGMSASQVINVILVKARADGLTVGIIGGRP